MAEVYGAAAAAAYVERAPRGFGAALAAPAACLWSVGEGGASVGLLLGILRGDIAEITLVHVLGGHLGAGVEHALVRAAADDFRARGARGILCESMSYAPVDLDGAFGASGFESVRRGLFTVPVSTLAQNAKGNSGAPITASHFHDVAACIAAAYEGHPGRLIHPEVSSEPTAHEYLLRALAGVYGPILPNYCRVAMRGGTCAGALLGCEIAPEMGFVLQVVVRPEFRGQGIATGLLRGFADACASAGVATVGLGVTLGNPARRLYERLGFGLRKPVMAYHAWHNISPEKYADSHI